MIKASNAVSAPAISKLAKQSTTKVKPFICTMPMKLDDAWNQIQFNLADFTRRAYGTNYVETLRITVHANCRLRRIYFSDRLYSEEELPPEFKLFMPLGNKTNKKVYNPPMLKNKGGKEVPRDDGEEQDIPEAHDDVIQEEEHHDMEEDKENEVMG